MTTILAPAVPQDIAELRQLYYDVYGHGYPVALGSDPTVMHRLITDPHTHWLTARRTGTGELVGSAVVQTDRPARAGKLVGLAVAPSHRGHGLAGRLTGAVTDDAFATGGLDSVHATVRTVSPAPQQVVARNGFRPLGLMPNAADVSGCETLALFARFADGVLGRRAGVEAVPEALLPLLRAAEQSTGVSYGDQRPAEAPAPHTAAHRDPAAARAPMEVITAPGFVRRRFRELFPEPLAARLPLHLPNAVLTPPDGEFEFYADVDTAARSCTLLAVHPYPPAAIPSLDAIVAAASRAGAGYVQTLLPLSDTAALHAYLSAGFVPSALYPAMRRTGDVFHDHVVLSRSDRRTDFRTMAVSALLQPYLSAYLTAWTATYLPRHEVAR
ncbi:GNAT family N-acetyltransferase [Streptomyces sp. NBC_00344]|uniref:GNAT family N-acetyltransferase n=1 Tax=Streptomyces sp. NBC_00344 TaxID=2975720 RepID=UPI002E207EB6